MTRPGSVPEVVQTMMASPRFNSESGIAGRRSSIGPISPPAILENTYFSGLMGAIPYDVLDLPPGDHRLVLSYVVQVGLLRGRAETDVLFSLLPRH